MAIKYQRFAELTIQQRNQLFANYAEQTGAFLLDSSNSDHEKGRYDIIAVQPLVIFTGKDLDEEDPLDSFNEDLQQLTTDEVPKELAYLPCIGGLFFALAYDFGKYYETITSHAVDDLKLADFFVGLFGCIIIIDRKRHCSFLICSEAKSSSIFEQLSEQINELLKPAITHPSTNIKPSFTLETDWQANFSVTQYAEAFHQVQAYIQAGDCYQVSLSQRFTAQCSGSSWQAYCALSDANNAPFSAFINTGEADILCLSPERFIKHQDRQVETRPIKGTRARGQSPEHDRLLQDELLASKKDQAENLMIVDLMRNDLGRSCMPGSIKVTEFCQLETFHSVHHLVSTIQGRLQSDEDAFSLLATCFPGGSVTGAPKIRAMNIIDQLEPHKRSYYCGSIGYIDIRGNMDSNISIRTLIRKNEHLYCWAGGALVSESILEDEYQETFDKVSRILPILGRSN